MFCVLAITAPLAGEPAPPDSPVPAPAGVIEAVKLDRPADFNIDILPILQKNCLSCHSGSDAEAGLVLETPATMIEGGDSGPAIVPGRADESLLLKVVARLEKPYMPPKKNEVGANPLTPRQRGLIQLWINEGAAGPVQMQLPAPIWQLPPPGWNPIYAVALSSDGQVIACGRAGRLHVYHMPTRRLLSELADPDLAAMFGSESPPLAHRDAIQSLAFSPDGGLLASGGYQSIKLWKRNFDQQVLDLPVKGSAHFAAVSSEGRWHIWAGEDRLVLLDLQEGSTAASFETAGPIRDAAFSPDGRQWCVVISEGALHVRSTETVDTLEINAESPLRLVSCAKGWIAAVGEDQQIRIWTQPTDPGGKPVILPRSEKSLLNDLATILVGEKYHLAGAFEDGQVRIWDIESVSEVRAVNHGAPVTRVEANRDGGRLLTVGRDQVARLWKTDDGTKIADLTTQGPARRHHAVQAAQFAFAKSELDHHSTALKSSESSQKSSTEVIKKAGEELAGVEKTVAEKQVALDEVLKKRQDAEAAAAEASKAAESGTEQAQADKKKADEALEAAKKAEGEAGKSLEVAKTVLAKGQREQQRLIRALAEADRRLAEAKVRRQEAENHLKAAEADQQQAALHLEQAGKSIRSAAFSPDGALLVLGGEHGALYSFSADSGAESWVLQGPESPVLALGMHGANLVTAIRADGSVQRSGAVGRWQLLRVIEPADSDGPPVDRVLALAFSPDGQLLASSGGMPSRGGEMVLWKVADGAMLRQIIDPHSDVVYDVSFSFDGRYLASGGADKMAKVFELEDGRLTHTFEGHASHVLGVAWNRTGRTISTAGADDTVKVWDVPGNQQLQTIRGFSNQVMGLQYLGFGDDLAVAWRGGPVRIVRENGKKVRDFEGDTKNTCALALSGDGKLMAAGGLDGILHIQVPETGKLVVSFEPPAPKTPAQGD